MSLVTDLRSLVIAAGMVASITPAIAETSNLPPRNSPIPPTTNSVPHVQVGVKGNPAISKELMHRVSKFPGVEIRETVISLPGAKGFWINDSVTITRPQVIIRGREFAHIHPDGSLHASLSPKLAKVAVKLGWATYHPWSGRRPELEGFVMIYTPGTKEELDVVLELIQQAYNFVTENS